MLTEYKTAPTGMKLISADEANDSREECACGLVNEQPAVVARSVIKQWFEQRMGHSLVTVRPKPSLLSWIGELPLRHKHEGKYSFSFA